MRVTTGTATRHRRNRVMKLAKGYRAGRGHLYRTAVNQVEKALKYAYRDRKVRKREMRGLWIVRIGAAARELGTSYSKLMGALRRKGIELDRKVLADLAVRDPAAFRSVVEKALA